MAKVIRLYLALVAWALWFGGFAFYFGVVVPTGGKVLGGSEQGFVTQQVTHWLNLISVPALALLVWDAIERRSRLLITTWALLAMLQVGLFVMHRQLDFLIDAPSRVVTNEARFSLWHEWYEFVAAIQWFIGMVHLGGIARSAVEGNGEKSAALAHKKTREG